MNNICSQCGDSLDTVFNCTKGHNKNTEIKPYTCPVCNGRGKRQRPSWVAGDQDMWISDGGLFDCRTCSGTGIVWFNI